MRTPPRRRTILRDYRKHEFGRSSASPPILRRSEEAANIKNENPNRAKVVHGSTWTGFFLSSSYLTDCPNQQGSNPRPLPCKEASTPRSFGQTTPGMRREFSANRALGRSNSELPP